MNDIHSLPDSLREQIQDAASSILQPTSGSNLPLSDPVQQVLAVIARQSPELFVAMIVAKLGCCGIETVETEETSKEKLLSTYTKSNGHETKLQPVIKRKTISRKVRFLAKDESGLRERT